MTRNTLLLLLAGIMIAGSLIGCKEDAPPSLWDPNYVSGVPPTVTSIDPPTNALAGVTTLTIHGTNFSPVPGNNLVFFDLIAANVLQSTSTQILLTAPNLPKDSIQVKVAVLGSDRFSPIVLYHLFLAADAKFGGFAASDEPFAVECDAAGNVYVSIVSANLGVGVKKFTPAGVKSDYSPAFGTTVASWRGMKFGPAGAMFCVAGRSIIFQIPPGGGTSTIWLSGSGLGNLSDLDFDAHGNIWTGGPTTNIFRVKTTDKSVLAFPFAATVRAVRVYNGYLYAGGKQDSLEKVWRFPIDTRDSLGAAEEYFNLSSIYGANSYGAYALTFDTDGTMYVGTSAPTGILLVKPDRTSQVMYPGILEGQTVSLTFGSGVSLYQSRSGTTSKMTVVNINSTKTGAPYYGRTLP